MTRATLNVDMGESYGIYDFGADEKLIDYIDLANVACGFHASDFSTMHRAVALAAEHDVRIGAHPSLPDRQGFGRREMAMSRGEIADCLIYQIGALSGFLQAEGLQLNHVKPHGALYGMAARNEEVAQGICDALDVFEVPILGLPGTCHETVYRHRGHDFIPEYFADLDYDENGHLQITRRHGVQDTDLIARRITAFLEDGAILARDGSRVPVVARTVCVHSDTPNAAEVAELVSGALKDHATRAL